MQINECFIEALGFLVWSDVWYINQAAWTAVEACLDEPDLFLFDPGHVGFF